MLVALRHPRIARCTYHSDQDRLIRRARRAVRADIGDRVQPDARMIAARTMDRRDPQRGKRPPVPQRHIRINQWHFDQVVECCLLPLRQLWTEIRDHHVPAGEHAMLGARGPNPIHPRIDHLGNYRRVAGSPGADGEGGAAEPDADGIIRPIKRAVIDARSHDVFDRAAGHGLRGQAAHEKPRDAGVAIREVEFVRAAIGIAGCGVAHMRCRPGIELQALEAGQIKGPDVERGDGVDPDAPFTVGAALVERDHRRIDLDQVEEIVAIADPGQTRLFLGGREPR